MYGGIFGNWAGSPARTLSMYQPGSVVDEFEPTSQRRMTCVRGAAPSTWSRSTSTASQVPDGIVPLQPGWFFTSAWVDVPLSIPVYGRVPCLNAVSGIKLNVAPPSVLIFRFAPSLLVPVDVEAPSNSYQWSNRSVAFATPVKSSTGDRSVECMLFE